MALAVVVGLSVLSSQTKKTLSCAVQGFGVGCQQVGAEFWLDRSPSTSQPCSSGPERNKEESGDGFLGLDLPFSLLLYFTQMMFVFLLEFPVRCRSDQSQTCAFYFVLGQVQVYAGAKREPVQDAPQHEVGRFAVNLSTTSSTWAA